MNEVINALGKVEHVEDAILVGLGRASGNIKLAIALLNAGKQANVGDDTNALIDALLGVANKLQAIVGTR